MLAKPSYVFPRRRSTAECARAAGCAAGGIQRENAAKRRASKIKRTSTIAGFALQRSRDLRRPIGQAAGFSLTWRATRSLINDTGMKRALPLEGQKTMFLDITDPLPSANS